MPTPQDRAEIALRDEVRRLCQTNMELLEVLKAVNHTLSVHGHIDSDTDLHEIVQAILEATELVE